MRYYPLFLDITGRKCVVVGGGNVAERKVERLLDCGARVEVVGKSLTPLLAAWNGEGKVVHRDADYEDSCLVGAFLVIGATDDGAVNGRVATDARALGIPVNIVDDPARCDFILPSIVERGDLSIAVSTGGRSPALAKNSGESLRPSTVPSTRFCLRSWANSGERSSPGGAPPTRIVRVSRPLSLRRSWIISAPSGGEM